MVCGECVTNGRRQTGGPSGGDEDTDGAPSVDCEGTCNGGQNIGNPHWTRTRKCKQMEPVVADGSVHTGMQAT